MKIAAKVQLDRRLVHTKRSWSQRQIGCTSITHQIAEHLGTAIVAGTYAPDSPILIESELSRFYGSSRSTLREAVKMLTAKGLIGSRPRLGTWVLPMEDWNLLDPDVLRWISRTKRSHSLLIELNEVRLAVEPLAARMAASHADKAKIRTMLAAVDQMSAVEERSDDPVDTDVAFHMSIMRAAGNPFFLRLCDLIETALRYSVRRSVSSSTSQVRRVADHRRVVDAIAAGDGQRAESAMRHIVESSLKRIRETNKANLEPTTQCGVG